MSQWSLYLLRCEDGKLYTGITTNIEKRMSLHAKGGGAKFMRGRGAFELAFFASAGDRSRASRLEYRVKKLSRRDKERLIEGCFCLGALIEEDLG